MIPFAILIFLYSCFQAMTDLLSVPMDSFARSRIYINGIISFSLYLFPHLAWHFWDPPKLLHASIVCSLYYSLLFHCVAIPQFVYSLNCWGTLDYFQCLDITNLAVLNIQVLVFLWLLFISTGVKLVGYICKYIFNFSWNRELTFTALVPIFCFLI